MKDTISIMANNEKFVPISKLYYLNNSNDFLIFRDFFKNSEIKKSEFVMLNKIIGTTHPNYIEYFFQNKFIPNSVGNRPKNINDLEVLESWEKSNASESIILSKIPMSEKFIITGGGNNRIFTSFNHAFEFKKDDLKIYCTVEVLELNFIIKHFSETYPNEFFYLNVEDIENSRKVPYFSQRTSIILYWNDYELLIDPYGFPPEFTIQKINLLQLIFERSKKKNVISDFINSLHIKKIIKLHFSSATTIKLKLKETIRKNI